MDSGMEREACAEGDEREAQNTIRLFVERVVCGVVVQSFEEFTIEEFQRMCSEDFGKE